MIISKAFGGLTFTSLWIYLFWCSNCYVTRNTYFCFRPASSSGQSSQWCSVYLSASAISGSTTTGHTTNAAWWSAGSCYTAGKRILCYGHWGFFFLLYEFSGCFPSLFSWLYLHKFLDCSPMLHTLHTSQFNLYSICLRLNCCYPFSSFILLLIVLFCLWHPSLSSLLSGLFGIHSASIYQIFARG